MKNDTSEKHYYQEQMNNKSFENREAMELYSQSFYHTFVLENQKVWPNFMLLGQTFHHLFFHVKNYLFYFKHNFILFYHLIILF